MTPNQLSKSFIALLVIAVMFIVGLFRAQTVNNPVIQGATMGTTYSVTLAERVYRGEIEELTNLIEDKLKELNHQMSTWDPESEISAINTSDEAGPFKISPAFAGVLKQSIALSKSTGGAFDATLNPLLTLWGFGSGATERQVPTDADIEAAKANTGWDKLWFDENQHVWKAIPHLELDLGAIAKGYGVDVLAHLLNKLGFENWFVEIGGEVVVRGLNPDHKPWRIGIQYPTSNPMSEQLQGIISMTNGAVATSGDYRNFIEKDGVLYSHILDPRSGRAVYSDTAGVTVLAKNCMIADGIATALFVMGHEEGLAWVEERPGIEAMFLTRDENHQISEKFSSGFKAAGGYSSSQ